MEMGDWKASFNGEYGYRWTRVDGKCPVLDLPNHKVRTYRAAGDCYIKSRFMVNVYIGTDDVLQEIMFLRPKTANDWVPVSPVAFRNIFSDAETYNFDKDHWCWFNPKWHDFVEFVEREGHILFKFTRKDWARLLGCWCGGVNLHNIGESFAGLLIRRFGPYVLTYPSLHPDTLKTMDDCADFKTAAQGISALDWKRRNNYFENEIQRSRNKMADAQKLIEQHTESYDKVCSEAAEAMNELSEKYGLNVNL